MFSAPGSDWSYLQCYFNATRPPLFLTQATVFFSSHEYHQPTKLNNSSTTTAQASESRRCLNIPSVTTPSIIPILSIMCGTIIPLPMIGLLSWPGYRPLSQSYAIGISKIAVPIMWADGFYKLRNSETGLTGTVKVKVVRLSCFAMGVRGSAKHLLGSKDHSRRTEERET